jgi:hypothetical protein
MSYILEGLKKLEKNRQRIGSQVLFTTCSSSAPPGRNKRKLQRYIMLPAGILILVIAAGAYWWLYATKSVQSAAKPLERQMTVVKPDFPPVQAAGPQREVQLEQKPLDPPLIEKQEDLLKAAQDKPVKKSSRRKDADVPPDHPSPGEGAGPVRSGEKIVSYNHLPDGVKKGLPEIKVFMHYYSAEPKERFVQINEHMLREGQSRPDGLKVVQISPHAAVLSYQGHRFSLQAVEK